MKKNYVIFYVHPSFHPTNQPTPICVNNILDNESSMRSYTVVELYLGFVIQIYIYTPSLRTSSIFGNMLFGIGFLYAFCFFHIIFGKPETIQGLCRQKSTKI